MTLNTARKIEWAFIAVTVIIAIPFALIVKILEWIEQPFRWVLDWDNWMDARPFELIYENVPDWQHKKSLQQLTEELEKK